MHTHKHWTPACVQIHTPILVPILFHTYPGAQPPAHTQAGAHAHTVPLGSAAQVVRATANQVLTLYVFLSQPSQLSFETGTLMIPFYRCGNEGAKQVTTLPKV